MSKLLWEHNLRSGSVIAWAAFVLLIELLQLLLCIPLIDDVILQFSQNNVKQGLISLSIVVCLILFSFYNYHTYIRHLTLLLTTTYAIHTSRIFFRQGFWPSTTTSISIDHIVGLHKLEYDDDKSSTLLIISDPASEIRGFDFERHEQRELASLEMIRNADDVVNLINNLKGSPIPYQSTRELRPGQIEVVSRSAILIFINRYIGSLYLLLSLFFLIYAVDAWYLTPKVIEDYIEQTTIIQPNRRGERPVVQTTTLGYSFGTYPQMAPDGSAVTLIVSPIFNTVTNVGQNGVYYKQSLTTSLHGVRVYIYFVTYVVILVSGIHIFKNRGRLREDMLPFVYIAPMGLLILSYFFWNLYR